MAFQEGTAEADPGTAPDQKPPILIVGNFLSESIGIRMVCEDLALRLRSRGWSVLTASNKKNRAARLLDMLATVWLKRRRFAAAQIDVYAGPAFLFAEVVAASLSALRCPFALTLHGGALPDFAAKWPRRVRRVLRSAAVVTAPSLYHQEGLRQYRPDIHVIRNGIDIALYPARTLEKARPRLVWIRAFHSIYNPVLAIDVVALLLNDFPETELVMVGADKGDGTLAQMTERVRKLGLDNRVRIIGSVPKLEIPHVLQEGDIFLNTTNLDNAPVTVVEAMACGLCVVSTNVGGIPNLLTPERDALLVPPSDSQAMAAAVKRICEDPGLARTLSGNARLTAEAFDWERLLPEWEEVFTRMVKAGS